MEGDDFEAADEEASDEGEDEDEYETMTFTDAGDFGEGAVEQVSSSTLPRFSNERHKECVDKINDHLLKFADEKYHCFHSFILAPVG